MFEKINIVKEEKEGVTINYFESDRFRFGYLRVEYPDGKQEDGLHLINKDTGETISILSEDLISLVPTLQAKY